MLKYINNKFSAYKYLVTYDVKGEPVRAEAFTDNIEDVFQMINTYPTRYSNGISETIEVTPEQEARLAEVNDLNLEHKENYLQDFESYVRFGVMTNQDPALAAIAASSKELTVKFLADRLKPAVKALRDQKSVGGVELFGRKFDSDSLAKENVTGYVTLGFLEIATKGRCDRTFDWKDYNNEFTKLTYEQICQLAKLVADHIQACFSAESLTYGELAKLEVKKLLKFPGNEVFDRVGKSVETEVDLSTGTTTTTEKKNPSEDLSSIYDSCYAIALKYIFEE
jgi:hypothetical protein